MDPDRRAQGSHRALEAFGRFVAGVPGDAFEWRWAILRLHIALQGFMVVAIRDTAGMLPLAKKVAAAWMAAHRSGRPVPRERLDSLLKLYRKIKCTEIATLLQADRLVPAGSQDRSVKLLNRSGIGSCISSPPPGACRFLGSLQWRSTASRLCDTSPTTTAMVCGQRPRWGGSTRSSQSRPQPCARFVTNTALSSPATQRTAVARRALDQHLVELPSPAGRPHPHA